MRLRSPGLPANLARVDLAQGLPNRSNGDKADLHLGPQVLPL